MKDDKGRVVIPNFYKGINLDKATKKVLEEVPSEDSSIKYRTQIAVTDKVGNTIKSQFNIHLLI